MAEKKFSQFAAQINNILPGDKLAGLRGGVNTIFTSQFGDLLAARLADSTDYSTGATYNNGTGGVGATLTNAGTQVAYSADGTAANVGDRVVLFGSVIHGEYNGIYQVTNVGSISTNWVLTRVADFNSTSQITLGRAIVVSDGGIYSGAWFVVSFLAPAIIGTDAIILISMVQQINAANLANLTNKPQARANLGLTPDATFTWNTITAASASLASNNGYLANRASLVTFTLPTTAAVNDIIMVRGLGAGGWAIAQNASQVIHFGNVDTTSGVGGSLASTNRYDCIELHCVVANLEFVVANVRGTVTYV